MRHFAKQGGLQIFSKSAQMCDEKKQRVSELIIGVMYGFHSKAYCIQETKKTIVSPDTALPLLCSSFPSVPIFPFVVVAFTFSEGNDPLIDGFSSSPKSQSVSP